jgi:hypothetical protein
MDDDYLTLTLTKLNPSKNWPEDSQINLGILPLEKAKLMINSLIDAIGEYKTETDRARAVALLITPMLVRLGEFQPEQCPPYKITPREAKVRFRAVLEALYGEDAGRGCRLL